MTTATAAAMDLSNPSDNDFALDNLGALFIPERVEMMKWMAGGMAVGGGAAAGLWFGLPALPPATDAIARIGQVLAMTAPVGAVILAMVVGCFRMFDTEHAMNPLKHMESQRYRITNRVLANTVEQAIVVLPPLLALGFLLEGPAFRLIPVIAGTWVISRLVFWAGYQLHMPSRGLGMVPTLLASFAAYGLLIHTLLG